MVLTFETADEILRCDDSIETFSAISLSWYTVFFCFSFFPFGIIVLKFDSGHNWD